MRAVILLAVLCLTSWGYAQEFQLQAADGRLRGPFEFKEGAVVAVGDARFTVVNVKSHEDRILEAMTKIRIPEVNFRQANIRDVIDFLHEASVKYDERQRGMSFILKLDYMRDAGYVPIDPFAAPSDVFGSCEKGADTEQGEHIVTFSALDITLKEALDIVVDVAGLKWRIAGSVIMIVPHNAPDGESTCRMYDAVQASVQARRIARLEAELSTMKEQIEELKSVQDDLRYLKENFLPLSELLDERINAPVIHEDWSGVEDD